MMHGFAATLTSLSAIALLRRMMAAEARVTIEAQAAKEERHAAKALQVGARMVFQLTGMMHEFAATLMRGREDGFPTHTGIMHAFLQDFA